MMQQKSLRDLGHVSHAWRKIKMKVVDSYIVSLSPGMTAQKNFPIKEKRSFVNQSN